LINYVFIKSSNAEVLNHICMPQIRGFKGKEEEQSKED